MTCAANNPSTERRFAHDRPKETRNTGFTPAADGACWRERSAPGGGRTTSLDVLRWMVLTSIATHARPTASKSRRTVVSAGKK